MKIRFWNVCDDITEQKYNHIKTFKSDILILAEVRGKSFEKLMNDWDYSLWYNDSLYEKHDYGIAIFSNEYKIEFTDNFNRNFRYVIPLKVSDKNGIFQFFLFAVWTKDKPLKYYKNIINALDFPGYKEYIEQGAIFIGDFNTNVTENNKTEYDNIINKGLIDCAKEILLPTYSHTKEENFFTADYCLATQDMIKRFTIDERIEYFDISIKSKLKYKEMSDHCVIWCEVIGK